MQSGHDEAWTDTKEVESVGCCPICALVPREAVAHSCGGLFCQSCWTQWQGQTKGCPQCRQGENADPAHRDRRTILNLKLACPACRTVVTLSNKQLHLDNACVNRRILCRECQEPTTPALLTQHLSENCKFREIICPDCKQKSSPFNLPTHQQNDCVRRSIVCNLCQKSVPFSLLDTHMQDSSGAHLVALAQDLKQRQQEIISLQKEVEECKKLLAAQAAEISELKANRLARGGGRRHPGRIGALPNGISRVDQAPILWHSDTTPDHGYTFDNYLLGWKKPLEQVFTGYRESSTWTCCGRKYNEEGCTTGF